MTKKETITKAGILKDMEEWEAICHEKIKEANNGFPSLENSTKKPITKEL